jgi:hypothetical protein
MDTSQTLLQRRKVCTGSGISRETPADIFYGICSAEETFLVQSQKHHKTAHSWGLRQIGTERTAFSGSKCYILMINDPLKYQHFLGHDTDNPYCHSSSLTALFSPFSFLPFQFSLLKTST